MSPRIANALREYELVNLDQVKRGERGLSCYTCGDKLVVREGDERRKHFSHTKNSKCHGEGPAHYRLKVAIRDILQNAIENQGRTNHRPIFIDYPCPDPEYAPNCKTKEAAPILEGESFSQPFELMRTGYHFIDLNDYLHRVECEVWLDNRRTRADVAGFNRNGEVIWAIEIKRDNLSTEAKESAKRTGVPLLVVDISGVPKPPHDNPYAEDDALWLVWENLRSYFLPRASIESVNTVCPRKEAGLGPDENQGRVVWGITQTKKRVLLHKCDSDVCPDSFYAFANSIYPTDIYTNPAHAIQSHNPIDIHLETGDPVVHIEEFQYSQRVNPDVADSRLLTCFVTGT